MFKNIRSKIKEKFTRKRSVIPQRAYQRPQIQTRPSFTTGRTPLPPLPPRLQPPPLTRRKSLTPTQSDRNLFYPSYHTRMSNAPSREPSRTIHMERQFVRRSPPPFLPEYSAELSNVIVPKRKSSSISVSPKPSLVFTEQNIAINPGNSLKQSPLGVFNASPGKDLEDVFPYAVVQLPKESSDERIYERIKPSLPENALPGSLRASDSESIMHSLSEIEIPSNELLVRFYKCMRKSGYDWTKEPTERKKYSIEESSITYLNELPSSDNIKELRQHERIYSDIVIENFKQAIHQFKLSALLTNAGICVFNYIKTYVSFCFNTQNTDIILRIHNKSAYKILLFCHIFVLREILLTFKPSKYDFIAGYYWQTYNKLVDGYTLGTIKHGNTTLEYVYETSNLNPNYIYKHTQLIPLDKTRYGKLTKGTVLDYVTLYSKLYNPVNKLYEDFVNGNKIDYEIGYDILLNVLFGYNFKEQLNMDNIRMLVIYYNTLAEYMCDKYRREKNCPNLCPKNKTFGTCEYSTDECNATQSKTKRKK